MNIYTVRNSFTIVATLLEETATHYIVENDEDIYTLDKEVTTVEAIDLDKLELEVYSLYDLATERDGLTVARVEYALQRLEVLQELVG